MCPGRVSVKEQGECASPVGFGVGDVASVPAHQALCSRSPKLGCRWQDRYQSGHKEAVPPVSVGALRQASLPRAAPPQAHEARKRELGHWQVPAVQQLARCKTKRKLADKADM